METKQSPVMVQVEKTGGRTRWLAITASFLAIGVILRYASPSFAGVTPNWIIPMYCLAILLIRADFKQALGIGLVAGAVCVVTSKGAVPWANIVSEPAGTLTAAAIAGLCFSFKSSVIRMVLPAVCGFLGTLASGLTFILITNAVVKIPLIAMLLVVLTVAAISAAVVQVLYIPAARLLAGPAKGR